MKGHHRPQHERLAIGISLVSTNLLLVCVWLWWAFGTQNGFADLAVDVLKDPSVRSVVAEQVVGALESPGMTSQVAVDFYAAGDLFDVVDQLNGVARPVTA